MFSLESFLIIGVVMLVIGTIIGIVIGRSWVPPEQQKELEQRLANSKKELDNYQQDVAQHFFATSKKVGELTQSYKDLHEHLTKGALQLANTEIGREVLAAGEDPEVLETLEQAHIEAPKDWAPKTPGSHGMLSEEFGLKDQKTDEPSDDITNIHK